MSKRLRGEPQPDMAGLRNKMSDWRACRRRTACGTDFRHGFGRVVARNPTSMNGRSSWVVSSDQLLHLSCSLLLSRFSLCTAFDFLFTRAGSLISIVPPIVRPSLLSSRRHLNKGNATFRRLVSETTTPQCDSLLFFSLP